jgi:predicted O-methyltransferase YrrM
MIRTLDVLLATRPTALNWLHAIHLAQPCTQTHLEELACLSRHARGRRIALEIGTFQGVSAATIAATLHEDGVLYCVDPWPPHRGRETPSLAICKRHLKRAGVWSKLRLLQGTSETMREQIPEKVDFAFIDGDHSYDGLARDWQVVQPRLADDAVVAFHDTSIPEGEPTRDHECRRYFEQVIKCDPRIEHIECVRSTNIVRCRHQ